MQLWNGISVPHIQFSAIVTSYFSWLPTKLYHLECCRKCIRSVLDCVVRFSIVHFGLDWCYQNSLKLPPTVLINSLVAFSDCLSATDLLSHVLISKREMCCLSEAALSCKLSGLPRAQPTLSRCQPAEYLLSLQIRASSDDPPRVLLPSSALELHGESHLKGKWELFHETDSVWQSCQKNE